MHSAAARIMAAATSNSCSEPMQAHLPVWWLLPVRAALRLLVLLRLRALLLLRLRTLTLLRLRLLLLRRQLFQLRFKILHRHMGVVIL